MQFEGVSPNLDGMLLKISSSVVEFRKVLNIPRSEERRVGKECEP